MRWPWQAKPEPERRQSGGDFQDLVLRAIEAEAAGTAADVGSTAAIEAAAGALSRAMAASTVEGPEWAVRAVQGGFLAQVGRDLVRSGQSLHVIRTGADGMPRLILCDSWHFEGGDVDPETWQVRATAYGPAMSQTWLVPASGVVFVKWGATPGQPYVGIGPTRWAGTTARLQYQSERSLADEAAGPLAQLLAVPPAGAKTGPDGEEVDPLALLAADIARARGRAAFVETTASGFDQGRSAAPQRDWNASRLGPNPPAALATVRQDAFNAVLAACGVPPDLFSPADGTAQREALRRYHLGTVLPLARLIEAELSRKLETDIRLGFDSYALDMVSRAQVVHKLTAAGVDIGVAMAAVGLDA